MQQVPSPRQPEVEIVATIGTVEELVSYCRDIMPQDKADALLDSYNAMRKDSCTPFYMLKSVVGSLATWLQYGN